MQQDSAEQHKNHILNLMSNDTDGLEDRKNQPTLDGDSLVLRANSSDIKVMRRNGAVVPFEASKISIAMTKAFLAVQGGTSAASAKVRQMTEEFTARVTCGGGVCFFLCVSALRLRVNFASLAHGEMYRIFGM